MVYYISVPIFSLRVLLSEVISGRPVLGIQMHFTGGFQSQISSHYPSFPSFFPFLSTAPIHSAMSVLEMFVEVTFPYQENNNQN